MPTLVKGEEREALDKRAAEIISGSIFALLKTQDSVNLAIPGGRSVASIFKELTLTDIPWNKVHIFMVDERLVPIDDRESNYKLAKDTFIGQLVVTGKLPKDNVHVFDTGNPERGIKEYNSELKSLGNRLDIVLLSAGEDCHVASLFPGHPGMLEDSDGFMIVRDVPKSPVTRMSASLNLLMKTEFMLLLFYGEHKRQAFDTFKNSPLPVQQCPAKMAEKIKHSWIITDMH